MNWKIIDLQPELAPYENDIDMRMSRLRAKKNELLKQGQTLKEFSNGHFFYGLHKLEKGWVYREWAPAAQALHMVGDFNFWNHTANPMRPIGNGNWEIRFEDDNALQRMSCFKVAVTANGKTMDRMPLYTFYTTQDEVSKDFCAVVWNPEAPYIWHDAGAKKLLT